jgi:drug/metabolite transporter (DMT)-like permease
LRSKTPNDVRRLGFTLLAALTLFWGLNFPAMKVVLSELTPWTFRALCLSLGGVGLLVINRLGGKALRIPRSDIKPLLFASAFNITGWHLCSAYGLVYMAAGRAVIIAYTMPLWASILAVFLLGEQLTLRRSVGLGLGLAGLAALMWPSANTVGASPMGIGFILAASWCWATGAILVKRHPWTMPLALVTAWMFIIGGVPVFIGATILESIEPLLNLSLKASLTLAYVILLPVFFCHWAFYRVVIIFPVGLASLGMLAVPVLGVFASALALDEPLGWPEFVALILVVVALAIVLIKPEGSNGT